MFVSPAVRIKRSSVILEVLYYLVNVVNVIFNLVRLSKAFIFSSLSGSVATLF